MVLAVMIGVILVSLAILLALDYFQRKSILKELEKEYLDRFWGKK